ncbi:uncharacterized protein OCT59_007608 [Rhizophagus irregularis]|uniref:uncharacterized protein n=1 Tax=Rhizophagus irregularis TaxID=588596 RepID=UPI0033187EDA|nr:hypothetical protein OCT59_007608 [Rhizophagus irregularis]
MHMMNLHATTSLAKDFDLNLIDIYRIPEAVYDRAVEKKEKAGDALGRSFEEEGIGNRELRELEWKAYHKAYEERTKARIEHGMVRRALEQFGFH